MTNKNYQESIRIIARIKPNNLLNNQLLNKDKKTCTIQISSPKNIKSQCDFKQYAKCGDSNTINFKKAHLNNRIEQYEIHVDDVFETESQEDFYDTGVKNHVNGAYNGCNATVFCFGQQCSGKTYTMNGMKSKYDNFENRGIIPRAIKDIFEKIKSESKFYSVQVYMSAIELYQNEIYDLVNSTKMCRSKIEEKVESEEEALYFWMNLFPKQRKTYNRSRRCGIPNINNNKQRRYHVTNISHVVVQMRIIRMNIIQSNATFTDSVLTFVELSSSQDVLENHFDSTNLNVYEINAENRHARQTLTFLQQIFLAIYRNDYYMPYRQSKLTNFLSTCVTKYSQIMFIATLFIDDSSSQRKYNSVSKCLCTLRILAQLKKINLKPVKSIKSNLNEQIDILHHELNSLKRELSMHNILFNRKQINYSFLSEQRQIDMRNKAKRFLLDTDGKYNVSELFPITSILELEETYRIFKDICTNVINKCSKRMNNEENKNSELTLTSIENTDKSEDKESKEGKDVKDVLKSDSSKNNSNITALKEPSNKNSFKSEMAIDFQNDSDKKVDDVHLKLQKNEIAPTRQEAYNEFITVEGSELYKILKSNKQIYNEKKQQLRKVGLKINALSEQINAIDKTLERVESFITEPETCLNANKDVSRISPFISKCYPNKILNSQVQDKQNILSDERSRTAPKYDSSNGRLSFYICGRPVTVYASGRDGESYENAYKQASMPKSELKMDWVYGYQGKTNGRFNLHKLVTNEVIYYMAGVAVIYDHKLYNQRFYVEHTDDISAISVHPDKKTIATAQVSGHGKRKCDRTHIRIWDSIKLETLVVINSDDFKGPIVALDFSRHDNGQHIACIEKSSKSYYHVFNTIKTNVTRVCSMQSSGKSPMCIACSPMGPYVAICGKRQLEYINICYENFNYVKHKALAEADYTKGSEKIDCFTSLIYTQNGTLLCTDSRGSLLIFHHTLNNDKLGLSLKTHVQVSSSPLLSIALKDDCAYVGGKERMVTKILLQDIDNLQFEHLGDLNETYGSIRTILPMDDYYLVGTTINALICFESKENQHIVSKAASDEAWALSIDEEHKAILGSNGKEL
ncbi:hypothetical protein A3Q56_04583, partial [Intoshia linei]